MKFKQAGFTLIELVVVITILGILAAIAIPRFVDLQGNARLAKMQAAAGAVKSASALAHSAAIVSSAYPNESTVGMEGVTINLTHHYPAATLANGIGDAAQLSSTDYGIVTTTGTTATGTSAQELVVSDRNNTTCAFTYIEAGTGLAPTIDTSSLVSTNC